MKGWRDRIPCCILTVLLMGACGSASAQQPRATLDRYCTGCHNSKLKTGGLALDDAAAGEPAAHPEIWEKVVRKLRVRSMPPAGLPRPDEPTYHALISALETSLDRAAAAHPNPGRTDTFRRLNRTEYQNAIRDLLALDVDVAPLLPSDDSSHGFDNVTVGDLSPTLLERYLSAARKISRLALGSPTRSPAATPSSFRRTSPRRSTSTSCRSARAAALVASLHLPARRRVRNPGPPDARPQRACRRSDRAPRRWN